MTAHEDWKKNEKAQPHHIPGIRAGGEIAAHPDALEHVDDVVDPAALDAEPLGRVVQPNRLHVLLVVQRHEATAAARREAGSGHRAPRGGVRRELGTRRRDETGEPYLEQSRPSDFCLRLYAWWRQARATPLPPPLPAPPPPPSTVAWRNCTCGATGCGWAAAAGGSAPEEDLAAAAGAAEEEGPAAAASEEEEGPAAAAAVAEAESIAGAGAREGSAHAARAGEGKESLCRSK
jgi:hypothetical protein